MKAAELHTLYRFFNAVGTLLYVGVTKDPPTRFADHQRSKEWWLSVARIELEQRASQEDLEEAEREAIAKERPLHNNRSGWKHRTRRLAPDVRRLPNLVCEEEMSVGDIAGPCGQVVTHVLVLNAAQVMGLCSSCADDYEALS